MSEKKLSKNAYGGVPGSQYVPYITSGASGYNAVVLIIGVIFAAIFAASSAYSGMKAGLIVAAGIPGSIIGSVMIASFARSKGILGKNTLQGMACGGETIASGMIYLLPAIYLVGASFSFTTALVCGLGGLCVGMGISSLMYNYLIVEEHGSLVFPESMAISETLVASDGNKKSIKYMGLGFIIGGALTTLGGSFFNVANTMFSVVQKSFYKCKFESDVSSLLLGIGFIVGLEVSLAMFMGTFFSHIVMMPIIGYFTELADPARTAWNDANLLLINMDVNDVAGSYVKYIGAGMMLGGGIIGVIKLIPTIISSLKATLGAKQGGGESGGLLGILLCAGIILAFAAGFIISGNYMMAVVGTVLSVFFSSLFVIVAARLCGMLGTSNLPVSGMTIASIVIITLVFVQMGWTSFADNKSLLLFGTFVVTAIALGGGYNQTQKVTFIMGGNKNEIQRNFLIAGIVGVVVVIGVIMLLKGQLVMTHNAPFALPQANLIATLTSGIMQNKLPWVMIIAGIGLSIVLNFLNLPIMIVSVGFYLPIATTSTILAGALIRVALEKVVKDKKECEAKIAAGVSLSSGLVAGGAIIGLIGIALQVSGLINPGHPTGFMASNSMALILLGALIVCTALPIFKAKAD